MHWVVIAVAVLIAAMAGGIAWAYFGSTHKQSESSVAVQKETSRKVPSGIKNSSSDAKPVETASPSTSPSTAPTASSQPTQSSAPKTTAPKPSSSNKGHIPSTPPPPAAFTITSVSVSGATWYCVNNSIYLMAGGITNTNSTAGGQFTWMIESSTTAPLSTPIPTAFPAGRQYLVSSHIDHNGPAFSGYVTAGQSIRFRVTSPNSIASPWYTVPANTTCP